MSGWPTCSECGASLSPTAQATDPCPNVDCIAPLPDSVKEGYE